MGELTLASAQAKPARQAMLATKLPRTRGSLQPRVCDSIKPYTTPPSPADAVRAPSQSMCLASVLRLSGTCQRVITITAAAIGTLIKNTQCQEACSISHPPNTGPVAEVMVVNPDQVPMARPREPWSKLALIMARLPGTSSAAPIPCIERAPISSRMLEENPHQADAAANRNTPIKNMKRRPRMSPSAPPASIRAERNNPYDSTTHCTSTTVARKLAWSTGRATLTTVLSMNAMLEPSIAAANTQGRDSSRQGTPWPADRITPSSQGGFMHRLDARAHRGDSKISSCRLPISWQLGATPFAHYTSRSRQELATFLYPAADLCNHDFENRICQSQYC